MFSSDNHTRTMKAKDNTSKQKSRIVLPLTLREMNKRTRPSAEDWPVFFQCSLFLGYCCWHSGVRRRRPAVRWLCWLVIPGTVRGSIDCWWCWLIAERQGLQDLGQAAGSSATHANRHNDFSQLCLVLTLDRWWTCHWTGGGLVTGRVVDLSLDRWWTCHWTGGGLVTGRMVDLSLDVWWTCHRMGGGHVTGWVVDMSLDGWWPCHWMGGGHVTGWMVNMSLDGWWICH